MKILIAEDESIIRMDLRETLERAGHEVVGEAADGEEAVTLARSLGPDVCLFDIKMPRKTGLEAAREVTGEGIAPVVVLTAFRDSELIREATASGIYTFLVKPFREPELLAALEVARERFGEVSGVKQALEDRKVIDRTRGALMKKFRLSEDEAFSLIRKRAMDKRVDLGTAAREILGHEEE